MIQLFVRDNASNQDREDNGTRLLMGITCLYEKEKEYCFVRNTSGLATSFYLVRKDCRAFCGAEMLFESE